jgi:NAD(P)-dependent dehydrogenase (short-subunit alcohol dehydrogenase family)
MKMTETPDPRSQFASGELPEQEQEVPGQDWQMDPAPDHGEDSYRGSGKLEGRRALITGGDSGIGRAVAIAFAREGADVLINYLEAEEADAQETVRLVEDAGRKCVAYPGDIRDEQTCGEIVDAAVAELGGLDVLVLNAAFQMAQGGGLQDFSTEQIDRVFKTNVYSMFWICKAALPHLSPGSSIITTSSIEAYEPAPPLLDYAASKAAVLNLTKGLSQLLAPQGIRVNTVAPGPIWTPLIPATMPADKVSSFGQNTPLGRPGQPAEVAPAYVFLASTDSSYVTGERIGVAGGRTMP